MPRMTTIKSQDKPINLSSSANHRKLVKKSSRVNHAHVRSQTTAQANGRIIRNQVAQTIGIVQK